MITTQEAKPRTGPHWAEKVVWRITQDPHSNQANDKVIVCEFFQDDKLAHTRLYHMVPVRASDVSVKGCTLNQAIAVAIDRKFMVVPEFLSSMVELEIGFGIPSADPVVVASGSIGNITSLAEVYSRPLMAGLSANARVAMGASGDEEFGPKAVFIFLARI